MDKEKLRAAVASSSESEGALDAVLKDYPGAYKPRTDMIQIPRTNNYIFKLAKITDEERRQDKAEAVIKIRENRKLIAYYETYGFKVVPGGDEGVKTKMRGTIEGIVSACNAAREAHLAARKPTGAARKKTRRRRRTQRTRRHKKRGF